VTTSFTYESKFDQVATITDPLNHTTSFEYDTLGRVTRITDPLGHETTFTHNSAGQPLTVVNDLGETVQLAYDLGDLVTITNPLGHSTTQYFDAAGRRLRVTDAAGNTTRYEYNVFNQVTKMIDALGGQTTFTFDPNGNMFSLTDAKSKTTTWIHDGMNRVATRTDPLSRAESFTYDENGALQTWTDRKGQITTYGYDALDRQTFIGFHTVGTPATYASTITTTHDAGDRATSIVDSTGGTIERSYDLLDRLTEERTPEGTVAYSYDAAGRRATMQVLGQPAVSYTYDDANRLTGVSQATASVGIQYDSANRRTSLALPNGIVVEYGYDVASQLTDLTYKLGGATLGNLAYSYDARGQRITVTGAWARTGLPASLASATYDDANQIATWDGSNLTYDLNGNLISDGVRSYSWNARNELIAVNGPISASFSYDGVRRRRKKSIGGATVHLLYDGVNPVQELASGVPVANLLTGREVDQYFARRDAAGERTYLSDALGSTQALLDSSGIVQTQYTYEPFGGTTTTGMATQSAIGFTGREGDLSGLYFYRARYYDSRFQRFISEDPIGFGGSDVNLHAYVLNSPTNLTDPSGLCPPCAAVATAVTVRVAGRVVTNAILAALTAAAERAATRRVSEDRCWQQYEADVRRCKQCEPAERRQCYAQAMERYVACQQGKQVPPLFPDEPWSR
jgi:RHS repeat-associated protein